MYSVKSATSYDRILSCVEGGSRSFESGDLQIAFVWDLLLALFLSSIKIISSNLE